MISGLRLVAAMVATGGIVTLGVTANAGPSSSPTLIQPIQGVLLPAPGAAYVRLMPGCVWGTGARALSVTRKTGQMLNVVNLATLPHRFVAANAAAALVPLPAWPLPSHTALAGSWSEPGIVRLSTCSGATTLTLTIAKRTP